MSPSFVDTNIFYYHFLQDRVYGPKSTEIIRRIGRGEAAATSVTVIGELVTLFEFRIMQTNKRKDISPEEKRRIVGRFRDATSDFHDLIDCLVHLEKLPSTYGDAQRAFALMQEHGLGFNDAVNLSIMERANITDIYSFDGDFDKIPGLNRIVS